MFNKLPDFLAVWLCPLATEWLQNREEGGQQGEGEEFRGEKLILIALKMQHG